MKKEKLNSILASAILLFTFIFACSKDDVDNTLNNDTGIVKRTKSAISTIDTVKQAATFWNYGFTFSVNKSISIALLGLVVPKTGIFQVKLYNLSNSMSSAAIDSATISGLENQPSFGAISEVLVQPGQIMGISIVSDAYYKVKNIDNSNINYPFSSDNGVVSILSYRMDTINKSSFPIPQEQNFFWPCVDFKYKIK